MVSGALGHPFQKAKNDCILHLQPSIKEDTIGSFQVLEMACSTPMNSALAQILGDLEDFQV